MTTSEWYLPVFLVLTGLFLWWRVRSYRARKKRGNLDGSDRGYFSARIIEGIIILIMLVLLWLGGSKGGGCRG